RDIGQAVFYYTKGCDRDNGWACSNLARKYDRGIGVEKDKKKAAELFKKGCKFEHPDGCAGYGWLLYHGQQFQKDEKKGIKLLQRGCKEGVGWSCKELQKISSKK
ncbi:sel1 repeat family protein, partial [candidate division KSB1 bacterium]|nr:sel1 repeat family protein [candidate division KSB1 bacterium]